MLTYKSPDAKNIAIVTAPKVLTARILEAGIQQVTIQIRHLDLSLQALASRAHAARLRRAWRLQWTDGLLLRVRVRRRLHAQVDLLGRCL